MVIVSTTGAYYGHTDSKESAMKIEAVAKAQNVNLRLITDDEWENNKDNRELRATVFANMGESLK